MKLPPGSELGPTSPQLMPPQEETAKRFAPVRKLFTAFVTHGKITLLAVFSISYCWRERFWSDPVMHFTCPLVLFLLSLPILDYYGFSFLTLFRKYKDSARRWSKTGKDDP